MLEIEQPVEQIPPLSEFNINDQCRVELTPTGRAWYFKWHEKLWADFEEVTGRKFPEEYRRVLPLKDTPQGTVLSMWEIMGKFGSLYMDGLEEAPIDSITIRDFNGKREIKFDVNDDIFVKLTPLGREMLMQKPGSSLLYQDIGEFTRMQFHIAANIFAPEMRNGGRNTFELNAVYFPQGE